MPESLWDHSLRAAVKKDPSGACFLGAGWYFHQIRCVYIWKMAPPPSYHPLPVLSSPQLALPAQRQDSQSLASSSPCP